MACILALVALVAALAYIVYLRRRARWAENRFVEVLTVLMCYVREHDPAACDRAYKRWIETRAARASGRSVER